MLVVVISVGDRSSVPVAVVSLVLSFILLSVSMPFVM